VERRQLGTALKAVVTRVGSARVEIAGRTTGEIGRGLLILLGVARDDAADDARKLAAKIYGLRIFADGEGAMNLDLAQAGGAVLVVSQFTLLGDARKGRRPSFVAAAPPERGRELYEEFVRAMRALGPQVQTGEFGADMQVHSVNDGPVTILLDTALSSSPR
jgi:D-tyrosyl-tRNA(Tyr) deacylase